MTGETWLEELDTVIHTNHNKLFVPVKLSLRDIGDSDPCRDGGAGID